MKKSLNALRKSNPVHYEQHSRIGALFREFILGGQDGLVNVLGVILGIAIATRDARIVIIAGLAATFAESFSMAAVAYTSAKAEEDYYKSQEQRELWEIDNLPKFETKEIYDIYFKKGFRGKLLQDIVKRITSDKKIWLKTMMSDELGLSNEFISPGKSAFVVGLASLIGSFVPLTTFFFMPVLLASIWAVAISALALFITGAIEGKLTIGHWFKKGLQLMAIGMAAALIGFAVGKILGVSI